MKIKRLQVLSSFSYLWLKHVTGYDISQHCARCLLGEYDERISPQQPLTENLVLTDGIYYLCGVAKPYNWYRNFHLAFMPKTGSVIDYSCNGISVLIQDAVAFEISPRFIDHSDVHAQTKAFYTCRNWQFAYFLKQSDILKHL